METLEEPSAVARQDALGTEATDTFVPTARTTMYRHADRGSYDRALAHGIIDEALVCHVGFVIGGEAVVLPTTHARIGDRLYLHGAVKNRMFGALASGSRCSVTFTLVDGLVLARTAFHHSMNYRSVVVFGHARAVTDPELKRRALAAIVDHAVPGRMRELSPPSDAELRGTLVIELPIEEASAKVRSGPPLDSEADYAEPAWAGELPVRIVTLAPLRAPGLLPDRALSEAAGARLRRSGLEAGEERAGDYLLSADPSRIDLALVHRFLSNDSYWARGVTEADQLAAMQRSTCFGAYLDGTQVGFARVVTDTTRFAYLADVFVIPEHRGKGLGRALVEFVLRHPHVRRAARCLLGTRDAHPFYEKLGWDRDARGRFMVRLPVGGAGSGAR